MNPQRTRWLWLLLMTGAALTAANAVGGESRVCADPDNLPFSNERLQGFENKIAQLVADDLNASLQYTWTSQAVQELNAGKCDVIIGVPAGWGSVLTTAPYYGSSYVFVYSQKKFASLNSFDEPALRKLKIGLPILSGGGANPPSAYALADRGLAANVIGFPVYPPGKIIQAVASGAIDVAIVWGPFGGYFAKGQPIPLAVRTVSADSRNPSLRFRFDISMAVRHGDSTRKDQLDRSLERRRKDISKILEGYGVPVIRPIPSDAVSAKLID